MTNAREVEFFEISSTRSVLDEIDDELTPVQMARFAKQIERLEQHGWKLGRSYFSNVATSTRKLRELRLTLDKVEYRVLFSEEPGGVFVMLVGYKERANRIPPARIAAAEVRLDRWRANRRAK